MKKYLLKLPIYLLTLITLNIIIACKTEVEKNSSTDFLLTALIAQNCVSLNDCFDRYARTTDEGANFQVYSSAGVRVYFRSQTLDYSTYKPIASGSKWVTAVTIMREHQQFPVEFLLVVIQMEPLHFPQQLQMPSAGLEQKEISH